MELAKLVRYRLGHDVAYGLVRDRVVHHLASELWAEPKPGPVVASLDEVELLAPCEPTKIVAIGRNYAAHAAESGAQVPTQIPQATHILGSIFARYLCLDSSCRSIISIAL